MNRHDPVKSGREASLFKSNRSQAVRIPKELAFPEGVKRVEITREGDRLILEPVKEKQGPKTWAEYFANGPFVDDDFLAERDQGEFEEREPLD